jgi:diguanylate cyclase (GGDEF)-like protein
MDKCTGVFSDRGPCALVKNKISSRYTNKKLFSYFFVIFLVFGSCLAGTIGVIYNLESKDYIQRIKSEEKVSLKLQLALISNQFDSIISDLLFLSRQNELLQFVNFKEDFNKTFDEKAYKGWISTEYLELIRRKKIYDQIRYIDKTGMEIVRVNYHNGNPVVVNPAELQFKGSRYYFKDTFSLGPDEIFVSPLDLNIENGRIEIPFKPMIRFGIPIFDDNSQKMGVILFNYLAKKMLAVIEETRSLSSGSAMLLNREGFWLFSPDKQDEWGFMIDSRQEKNFSTRYPVVWSQIVSSEASQIDTREGLFTCATIFPLKQSLQSVKSSSGSSFAAGESLNHMDSNAYFWKLVSHIPRQDLNSGMNRLFVKFFFMAILLFLLAAIPSWIIAKAILRRKLNQIELYHSANYDTLTSLPNRSLFMDRLDQVLRHSKRYQEKFAVLFMDLDGFKAVNDTFGHDAGDQLLIQVASRLQAGTRDSDTVARLGGDEFTVIFSVINSLADARLGAQKIITSLSAPFRIKGRNINIGASIGVSVYPDDGSEAALLLEKSDRAMYQAKKEGKNRYKLSGD